MDGLIKNQPRITHKAQKERGRTNERVRERGREGGHRKALKPGEIVVSRDGLEYLANRFEPLVVRSSSVTILVGMVSNVTRVSPEMKMILIHSTEGPIITEATF